MELTQRLECTQELFSNQTERVCPEQIGFLGICGTKYPVKKGPNKIGRDPQTCNIILNLNSISRQHAVLNVLSSNEYMLMDLDSANKTKLQDKTLQPYIPHPLHNGDTVQFGQVFGIFRLLEDDTDLPMTQALDIPDTPIASKFMSKLNHVTTVPESPDVSDKDDSFIAPSQPKLKDRNKNTNSIFLKSSGKTISIQPVGQKKIDNVYWNSSKKSDSFSLHNNSSINESVISVKSSDTSEVNNIHELATQVPDQSINGGNNDSIFDADTQVPNVEPEKPCSPNIYSMETQVPVIDKEPNICEAINTKEVNNEDKENDISIFNAETQLFEPQLKTPSVNNTAENSKKSLNTSDDIILFDDMDSQPIEGNFESQAILPTSPIFAMPKIPSPNTSIYNIQKKVVDPKADDLASFPTQVIPELPTSANENINEDIDILPTQKIREINEDDDVTDCEDEDVNADVKIIKPVLNEDDTDYEEDGDDKIAPNGVKITENFENLETQDIIEENINANNVDNKLATPCDIEDMLTQIIPEESVHNKPNPSTDIEDMLTQVIETERPNPVLKQLSIKDYDTFKVPVLSPKKQRKKEIHKTNKSNKALISVCEGQKVNSTIPVDDDDPNYYAATQELFDDLCTQKDVIDSSVKNITKDLSSAMDKSFGSSDNEDKIEQFVCGLSSQEIRDVVGVDTKVSKLKKMPSDSSDIEVTPKKVKPLKFMNIDLPNSQEIKTSVTLQAKSLVTESSSDSDTENSTRQNTPLLFKSKKRKTNEAKLDLSRKLDVNALPTRIITRVRKPTNKLLNDAKNQSKSILKSNFIADQEDGINTDIINENIARLKSEKSKSSDPKLNKENPKKKEKEKHVHEPSTSKTDTDIKIDKERGKDKSKDIKDKPERKKLGRPRKDQKQDSIDKSKTEGELSYETRGRKRNSQENLKKSTSLLEIEELPEKRRRVKIDITGLSPDKEIRRSRRKRTTTTDNSINSSKTRTNILKHEQSTIYNISSESSVDSPSLKREASKEIALPAKRRRPAITSGISLRATPSRRLKTQYVLFTAFPCDEVKIKLEKLGAIIVSEVKECTVVLTLQIKRTFKLLCAVGLGKPIVGPQWVQACVDNNVIVDPWLYLLKDETTEKRFQFDLERSLVSRRNFLKGYNISATPSVLPEANEMKLIVECSGGTWKEGGSNWIVVSSLTDKALWPLFKKKGATIVSTEFVLGGVLRQKMEISRNKLA